MTTFTKVLSKIGLGLLIFATTLLFLIVTGAFWPQLIIFGQIGNILVSFWDLQILIIVLVLAALSGWLLHHRRSKTRMGLLIANVLMVLGSGYLLVNQVQTASKYDTTINWGQYLAGHVDNAKPDEKTSVVYGNNGHQDLKMQVTSPTTIQKTYKPLVLVHGGGYIAGARNQQPSWVKYYQSKGYVVFDVDYTLSSSTTHAWKQAPTDVANAIAYVQAHQHNYHVDMSKLVIAGSSAGGGIALQTAYGIADHTLGAKTLPTPKAVIAVYPGSDPYAMWYGKSSLLGMEGRICVQDYIGGSPDQYPERYQDVTPSAHITKNTPATLIIAGTNDHILPYQGQSNFAAELKRSKTPHRLVSLPYSDHFFDMAGGSVGSQIARKQTTSFLNTYAK